MVHMEKKNYILYRYIGWWEIVKHKIKQLTIEASRAINLSKVQLKNMKKEIMK